MLIRPAKIKDIDDIVKLALKTLRGHRQFNPSAYASRKKAPKFLKNLFNKSIYSSQAFVIVAEDQDRIIAYIRAEIKKRPPIFQTLKWGYISGLYVDEKYRRQGIATQLLEKIYPWLKKKKMKYLEIGVHFKNPAAKAIYQKQQFKPHNEILLRKL